MIDQARTQSHPMHTLRLFGGVSIVDPGGSPPAHSACQRHRLALLALLAVETRGLSRDKLVAYLWPERDTKHARNLLNVSVYVLRSALGEEVMLSRGDDLRLNLESIRADVSDFEAAMAREDHETAVDLHEGPFLDGFFLADSQGFELWADRQRDKFAGMYVKALESLACAAEARGDAPGAVEWWKRRMAQDRFDSGVTVRLMRALDTAGNRAGALELAKTHAELLREDFGTESGPEVVALAERMRSAPRAAGARLTADPVQAAVQEVIHVVPTRLTGPPPEPSAARPSGDGRARRALTAALLAVVALAIVLLTAWPRTDAPEASIAVLPFLSLTSEGDNEYFSDGVTEEIITHMSGVPGLKVISRTSAMRYKGSDLSLRAIADELDVTYILEGSVRQTGGSVRISAQLIDATADSHLWSSNYGGELIDIFGLQEKIAREVVQALEPKLGERGDVSSARRGTDDPEALELFLRGRHHWILRTREGHERARDYFERAIARDSSYADPFAGLAYTYLTSYQLGFSRVPEAEVYSRIKWAAERALALDGSSADAHVSLALALWWQSNWPGAERELLRALELNPGHATAHTWYALLLGGWGRLDEAMREIRRASELDPFAVTTSANYAFALYLDRRYDEAIEQWRKTMDLGGPVWMTRLGLGMSYALAGNQEQAIRVLREAADEHPDWPALLAGLAYALAAAGEREEALAVLERAKERGAGPFGVGRAYVALQEPDSAFAWLRRSPWQWAHRANRFDPALDPLRTDPRFEEMSAQVERDLGIR